MENIWPEGVRCTVVLGFDVDGVSGAIYRDPETAHLPSFMSMREYGPTVAVPRILQLLDDYQVKASFYIPAFIAETHPDMVKEIQKREHEIAHHGYMHEPPATLTREQEAQVLDKGIRILEGITGEKPVGYRSPSWELSEDSLALLSERGFLYDSSLMEDDIPYLLEAGSGRMVEIPVHWELDDVPYFNYAPAGGQRNLMASPEHVYQVWSAAFEGAYHYGRSFVLTIHPFVIGRPGRIRMLERLIAYIQGFSQVRFLPAADVAQEWTNQGR